MSDKSGRPENFHQTACLWAERTTLHSIYDLVFSKPKIVKLFWLCIFVGCSMFTCVQITNLMDNFLKDPHYRTNMFVSDQRGMELPNVTICNLNRVNRTKARELGMTPDAISHLFFAQMAASDLASALHPSVFMKHSHVYNAFISAESTPTTDPIELFRLLGHGCEQTFQQCVFNNIVFPCCLHATAVINGQYGLCWSIAPPTDETDGIPRQTMPGGQSPIHDSTIRTIVGIMWGLKMFLKPHLEEYSFDVVYNNIFEQGLVLEASRDPYITYFLNPTVIPPGQHARIGIAPEVRYTEQPNGFTFYPPVCAKSNARLQYLQGTYTKDACSNDCLQKMTFDNCNCTYVSSTKAGYRTCEPNDFLTCIFPTLSSDGGTQPKKSTMSFLKKCKSKCIEPCALRFRESSSVSMTPYPAEPFVAPIAAILNMSQDEVRSMILAELYFPQDTSLVVQTVEKTPISELIGNIGGQIGLWLGASVVTVVQMFYYLLYAIRNQFNKKSEKN